MYTLVAKHRKIVMSILVILGITFLASSAIGSFKSTLGNNSSVVATVADQKIYSTNLNAILQEFPNLTKDQALAILIERQLLTVDSKAKQLLISKQELQHAIANIPIFNTAGKFDINKYRDILLSQHISAGIFEQQIQQQLVMPLVLEVIESSSIPTTMLQQKYLAILHKQVTFDKFIMPMHTSTSLPTESSIIKYYQQHLQEFQEPAKVRVEYIDFATTDTLSNHDFTAKLQEINNIMNGNPVDLLVVTAMLHKKAIATNWLQENAPHSIFNSKLLEQMLQHGIFNGTNKNLVIAVDSQNSSHYIIMHVLEYQPAANAKLAVVKTQIIERINADEAVLKLHKLGESMLKNQVLLVKLPFVQPSTITLLSSNLKPALTLQLLSHHENYPFYLSDTTSDGSLVIYRVQTPAKSRESLTVSEQESILLNNASSARQLLSEAYLQSLALKYKVQINQLEGSH